MIPTKQTASWINHTHFGGIMANNSEHFLSYYQLGDPCDVPPVDKYHENCKIPFFNTVRVIGFSVLPIDSLCNKDDNGMLKNPARSQGIDYVNVGRLQRSFLSAGVDSKQIPPIVTVDGDVIDGNNRVEAYRQIGTKLIVCLVVELIEGFVLDDVYDEVGLSMNNHLTAKALTLTDCEKRLAKYFGRIEQFDTDKGVEWFNTFQHPFTDIEVLKSVEKVIKGKLISDTVSPWSKESVKKSDLIKDLVKDKRDVIPVNFQKKSNTKTYLARTLFDALLSFEDKRVMPTLVGFCSKTEAEDIFETRNSGSKDVDKINRALDILISKKIECDTQEIDFNFLQLTHWMPQLTDQEDGLIDNQ